MEQVAVVTGADRGLGLALCADLAARGWRVFAGQFMPAWPELGELAQKFPQRLTVIPLDVGSTESVQAAAQAVAAAVDHVDLLINNAGITSEIALRDIRQPQDYADMQRMVNVNTLGPIRMTEAFLPQMDRGEMKRLAYVSSNASSIERLTRTGYYGYCASKAGLNSAVKLLFNQLRPEGYTFRLYHPGWMRSYMHGDEKDLRAPLEPEEAATSALAYFLPDQEPASEDRLALRDWQGEEWPW